MRIVAPLFESDEKQRVKAGGKGAWLSRLHHAGFRVPTGFVLTSDAYSLAVCNSGLDKIIAVELERIADYEDVASVSNASKRIGEYFYGMVVPEQVSNELCREFDSLEAEFVAVRSSASMEDGEKASWAGQLETKLNTSRDELIDSVRACWASLYSTRALSYCHNGGFNIHDCSVGLVIQEMVNSDVSGIAFSVHPVTNDADKVVIEAGFGLGEAVVSGAITPDTYVFSKSAKGLTEKHVGNQRKKLVRTVQGKTDWVELPAESARQQKLSDATLEEVANTVIEIESTFEIPVDVEWAVEDGTLHILQSRPITTLGGQG
ncbi:Phosphoenolpyruvate synthase [Rubripirellula tenax]|uniref:Phosphoenolpyruvate synthase n=1 Tax=Rubripirellula tenax TaxID=2528015 RepID=A0A5C6F4Q2_9BACT|nr:PEP/pyruvate-binding domain-containing protein [Rubripirellula tenax]TWU54799.1 Phosphoenolpyruvate synthase [Rubripirellula tenax]